MEALSPKEQASYTCKAIRPFIGAKNFNESRNFYGDLGYTEICISANMSLFKLNDSHAFYLQDYYKRTWIDNTMIFIEVENVESCLADLKMRKLSEKYASVRCSEIKTWDWGREIFMHDPSGILWHFGEFNPNKK